MRISDWSSDVCSSDLDMPVVISLYNAFTGLAVSFEGFVLGNEAMIIAGMVVGAAGTLLTQLMAKALNRSIGNVLFGSFGAAGGEAHAIERSEEHTSELQSLIRISYAVFCLQQKTINT